MVLTTVRESLAFPFPDKSKLESVERLRRLGLASFYMSVKSPMLAASFVRNMPDDCIGHGELWPYFADLPAQDLLEHTAHRYMRLSQIIDHKLGGQSVLASGRWSRAEDTIRFIDIWPNGRWAKPAVYYGMEALFQFDQAVVVWMHDELQHGTGFDRTITDWLIGQRNLLRSRVNTTRALLTSGFTAHHPAGSRDIEPLRREFVKLGNILFG